MRIKLQRIAFALVVCSLLGTAAQAGVKSKNVYFATDVVVGETLVKQGRYKVAFDGQAKEVQILRGSTIIARATASLEAAEAGGKYEPAYRTLKANNDELLLTVVIGDRNAVVHSERISAARAASPSGQ